ncbi:hypothetical protein ALC57_17656 [Trachymyrmex cornetzi]|uniref:Uncharacterized protein n=1 Tax=Trachymyrmex cornetzi TaxID=471704 RepID=A0A151IT94_9HYME|nr:hypothetical protein ALC57_17656 [Trachymyrmex cornetzi]
MRRQVRLFLIVHILYRPALIPKLWPAEPLRVIIKLGTIKEFAIGEYPSVQDTGKAGTGLGTAITEIKLHALVCDAPAKSFILGVKNHNGYYSCTKCTEGKYVNGRVYFPIKDTNPFLQTDEDFFNNKYEDYQIVETIFIKIPKFGPITDVPLDYMHLVCLGVVKKLILLWLTGPLSVRLSNNMINNISEQLMQIRNSVPYDYTRRPRSMKHVRLWKATEFRQFFLNSK